MPDSVTQILKSGPPGAKINIAVLGDGSRLADQTTYNNKVQAVLLDGVFGHRLLLRGQVRLQHLPRQPDLGAVGCQPAGLRRERDAERRLRRHDRLDDAPEHSARVTSTAARGRIAGSSGARTPGRSYRTRSTHGCPTTISSSSSSTRPASADAGAAASRSSRSGRVRRSWRMSSAMAPAGSPTSTASRARTPAASREPSTSRSTRIAQP